MSPATSSSMSLVHLLFGQSGDFVLNPFLDIFLLLSLYEDRCAVWGKCELLGELQNASVCVREATSGQLQRCAQWPFALPVQAFFPTRTAEKLRNGIYCQVLPFLCTMAHIEPSVDVLPYAAQSNRADFLALHKAEQ